MNSSSTSFSRFAATLHIVPAADNMMPMIAIAMSNPMYVKPPLARFCRGRRSPRHIRRPIERSALRTAVHVDDSGVVVVLRRRRDPGVRGLGKGIDGNAADVAV